MDVRKFKDFKEIQILNHPLKIWLTNELLHFTYSESLKLLGRLKQAVIYERKHPLRRKALIFK